MIKENKNVKKKRKKNDTKMKHPQIITYKKAMGEIILGNLTPLAKSIKTLKRSVLRQKKCFELQVSCGKFVITLRMQPWS